MAELNKKDIYIVKKDDKAANSLMMKLAKNFKPGAVIFVTDDEFECLNKSVIRIDTDN